MKENTKTAATIGAGTSTATTLLWYLQRAIELPIHFFCRAVYHTCLLLFLIAILAGGIVLNIVGIGAVAVSDVFGTFRVGAMQLYVLLIAACKKIFMGEDHYVHTDTAALSAIGLQAGQVHKLTLSYPENTHQQEDDLTASRHL